MAKTMHNLTRMCLVTCLMCESCEQIEHKQQKARRHTSAGYVDAYESLVFQTKIIIARKKEAYGLIDFRCSFRTMIECVMMLNIMRIQISFEVCVHPKRVGLHRLVAGTVGVPL